MTDEHKPGNPAPGDNDLNADGRGLDGNSDPRTQRRSFMEKRREKIRAEIERNRRGEYKVPTWVLVVILLAVLAGWAAVIIFA